MDVRYPPEAEACRDEVHAFLAGHLPPAGTIHAGTSQIQRADAGPWNEQARA